MVRLLCSTILYNFRARTQKPPLFRSDARRSTRERVLVRLSAGHRTREGLRAAPAGGPERALHRGRRSEVCAQRRKTRGRRQKTSGPQATQAAQEPQGGGEARAAVLLPYVDGDAVRAACRRHRRRRAAPGLSRERHFQTGGPIYLQFCVLYMLCLLHSLGYFMLSCGLSTQQTLSFLNVGISYFSDNLKNSLYI